jgi:hypothetical protein
MRISLPFQADAGISRGARDSPVLRVDIRREVSDKSGKLAGENRSWIG